MSKGKLINDKKSKEQSVAGVAFDGPGSAEATPIIQNVSPLQVLLAGHFLIALAERQLNEAWSREAYRQVQEQAMVEELLRNKGL